MSEQDGYIIKLDAAEKTVERMATTIEDMQSANGMRGTYEASLASAWGDARGARAIEQLDKLLNGVQYIAHDLYSVATAFAGMAEAYREVHEPERAAIKCVAADPLSSLDKDAAVTQGADSSYFLAMDTHSLYETADWISSDLSNKINAWSASAEDVASQIMSNGNMGQKAAHVWERAKQIKDDLGELWQKIGDWSRRMKEISETVAAHEKQLQSSLVGDAPAPSAG